MKYFKKLFLLLISATLIIVFQGCKKQPTEPEIPEINEPIIIEHESEGSEVEFKDGSKIIIPGNVVKKGTKITLQEKDSTTFELPEETTLLSKTFFISMSLDSIAADSFVDFTDTIGINTSLNEGKIPINRIVIKTPSGKSIPFYRSILDLTNNRLPGVPLSFFKNVVCEGEKGEISLEVSALDFPEDEGGEGTRGPYGTMYRIDGSETSKYFPVTSPVNFEGKMPLILVHGWTFLPDGSYIWGNKECIYESWHDLIDYFYSNNNLKNNYKLYAYRYVRSVSISTSAEALDDLINNYLTDTQDSIVFVAHSMGGLVARKYVVDYGGHSRTKRLITLATPHHGSVLADIAVGDVKGVLPIALPSYLSTYDLRWDDMVYDIPDGQNNFLQNLNTNDAYTEKYKLFRGYITSKSHGYKYLLGNYIITKHGTESSSDGVVPTASSTWEQHPTPFDGDIVHFSDFDHSQMHTENSVFSSLYDYLVSLVEGGSPDTLTIELKNDDGISESTYAWAGACPLDGDLADGNVGFRKFLDLPTDTFEVLKVKVDFARKNKYNADFYLHIKDERSVDLLPTPFVISADSVNLDGWWELDVSDQDIMIKGSRIEVSIFECYLPANCPPNTDWSINGWTIMLDENSSGNSIMKGSTSSHDPNGELMIRLEGRLHF